MKKTKNKNSLANAFFLLGWSIFIISYIVLKQTELTYMYDTGSIYQIVKIVLIIIFSMKMIFIDKYSFRKLLCYYAILTLAFLNTLSTDNNTLFFSILIALSADNIDFKKIIKVDITIRLLLIVSIVGLSLIGVFPNFTRYINGSLKQAFGFLHPNILCFFVITILLEILYLTKKINLKYLIINAIVIYLLTIFCFSRTSVYAYILIFLIDIIIRNKNKFFSKKIVRVLFCMLPILLSLFSLAIVIGYGNGNKFSLKIDSMLTERIRSGYKFYKDYGITLFGNKIETISTRTALATGQHSNIFDMGYLRLLIGYGLIISTIVVGLLCLIQKNILDKKEYKLILISTFFILTGFAENNVYNIVMNFTLICIPYIFSKNSTNKFGDDKYEQS